MPDGVLANADSWVKRLFLIRKIILWFWYLFFAFWYLFFDTWGFVLRAEHPVISFGNATPLRDGNLLGFGGLRAEHPVISSGNATPLGE